VNQRKKSYSTELHVSPTHPEDPRRWFLSETTGQDHHRPASSLPWLLPRRNSSKTTPNCYNAIVAHVASEVEKLSVQDKPPQESMIPKNSSDKLQAAKPSSTRPMEEAAADQSAFPGKKNSTS
jgi:hypothetical protein